jgi:thioredoxin 1
MAENIVTLTKDNFESEVLRDKGVVLVDFWAAWCGPCRAMEPVLEEFASQYKDKVKVAKLNVDDHQAIASNYEVLSIPTMVVFKEGEIQKRIVGSTPKKRLEDELRAWIA